MNCINIEIWEVLSTFPGLKVEMKSDGGIKLIGEIEVNNTFKDEHILDAYSVEINIPNEYPSALPTIKETGKRIKPSFGHVYNNRELCLATLADMQLKLGKDFRLIDWFDNYVIPYFFSHSYYKRYGVLPFGERSHGLIGVLEFYIEYFRVDSKKNAYNVLKYVCKKPYRGHDICPCGSGKSIRNCHKDIISSSKESSILEILLNDLRDIEKAGGL